MGNEISEERKNTLDKLYHAFEIVSEGSYVYLCDMKYDYSRWSEEAVQYFGLPDSYMYGAGSIWEKQIHPDDQRNYHESIEAIFAGKDRWHDMQYRVRDRKGRYVVCTCRGTVLWDAEGKPDYFAGVIRNNGLVNHLDSLTGLQNQYGLFEHLSVLYDKQIRSNIMMIGIAHFSTVNEMWGYDFGNIVIHKLVQILKEEFRNEGALYRVDGVRFALLTRTLSIEDLTERYERIRKEICEKMEIDGYHPNLSVCGSALVVDDYDINPQAMFSCLEYAYNISKEKENGEFHIFRDEIDENRNNLLVLINTVRKNIEQGCEGFILYYQPIVDAKSQKLKGAEALLRWESPEYGLIPPGRFVPIIENDPSFPLLGEWILNQALKETKPFLKQYPNFLLNVNIAYEQLQQDSFTTMVKQSLKKTGYPANNLCLEITERCRLLDMKRLSGILKELREEGVRFAIDDFGTGYSSMNLLNNLKCEVIKIDKVFVDGLPDEEKNAKLIGIMNELAEVCGATTCVEGVETEEQCRMIRELGADSIQGYYYSRPLPLPDFRKEYMSESEKSDYIMEKEA